ncbi:C4-dicarboxylate TRAP transporter substrate-binding protein [Fusobacterium perfoetens]|uniref:C4-dicarboxylate TRAP transporter substrate-binding protein n=1 Tax=Fusobacterium perfoetens TaxID=852 RepID=UPI0004899464|nr:C4-dicarboxylate TRAP transporter substrate-binding protein [Fusobacterium perfoetens]MCI6152240.1 C4-dicarboxylate TRAP transporter substrate-binding protein [Fusobacterium perfoetens]MDY3237488.1 C4-dicarboxylate TRAP transporter substrate-binding protein [Fusobacterium perfoetens]
MKKILCVSMLLGTLLVGGCGGEKKEVVNEKNDVIVLQFGHDNNPGDPVQEAALYWAKILDERSNGTMKLEVFPSGQLGSKSDLIDQMLAGDAIAAIGNGPFYADRGVPDLGIMQAPYLFENWEQLDKLVASDWWKEQMTQLESKGMKIIGENWRYGVRHTITTKPVKSVKDLKGMKIRTQNSTIHVKGFEVLGATPTPMALSEVYTSLQQGTIEGLENPLSVIYSGKYQEVAKNLMLDGHIRDLSSIVVGTSFFNSLTKEQQELLISTCREAGDYQNKLAEQADIDCLEKLKKEGVKVTEIDFDEFNEKAKPFYQYKEITETWSKGLLERIKEIIK